MPITFDAASSLAVSSAVSTASWNHTVASSVNSILIVSAGFRTTASSIVNTTAVTYGGVALTKAVSIANQDTARIQVQEDLWYLLNPTAGLSSIHVTWSNSSISFAHGAFGVSYTGTLGVGSTAASTGASSAPSVAVTLTSANSWGVGALRKGNAFLATTVSGETLRAGSTAGGWVGQRLDVSPGTSGSNTLNLTGGTAVLNAFVALELLSTSVPAPSALPPQLAIVGVGL